MRCFQDKEMVLKKGLYKHFKGNYYEVLGLAKHSETLEKFVVYRPLYGDRDVWVRPLAMFDETIERDGRSLKRFEFQVTQTVEQYEAAIDNQ